MPPTEAPHFRRLRSYYDRSRRGYNLFLWGAKHFGYYPLDADVSEREAQDHMHDVLASKLGLDAETCVLDAGCGQGVVATYLAKHYGCSLRGIDVVPFEIGEARRLAEEAQVADRVQFELMDYSNMSFDAGTFDALFTLETLSHSPDPIHTLREFCRVLRPQGRLALFEYSLAVDEEFTPREMRMLDIVTHGSAMEGLKAFRHECFHRSVEAAGFIDVKTEDITEHVKPSLERLRRYARIPYIPVRLLRLQKFCPNVTAAIEFHRLAQRALLRYNIYTGRKPAE